MQQETFSEISDTMWLYSLAAEISLCVLQTQGENISTGSKPIRMRFFSNVCRNERIIGKENNSS
jgi:hypothetical protein